MLTFSVDTLRGIRPQEDRRSAHRAVSTSRHSGQAEHVQAHPAEVQAHQREGRISGHAKRVQVHPLWGGKAAMPVLFNHTPGGRRDQELYEGPDMQKMRQVYLPAISLTKSSYIARLTWPPEGACTFLIVSHLESDVHTQVSCAI
eukprot:1821027-Amphidinium_carterae.1